MPALPELLRAAADHLERLERLERRIADLETMVARLQQLGPAAPPPSAGEPFACEAHAVLPTVEAVRLLNRQPQTLRAWASRGNGPLRPIRINGRLAWPVADLQRLLQLDPGRAPGRKKDRQADESGIPRPPRGAPARSN